MTKKLFMIKHDFFNIIVAKNIANEINDEIENRFEIICDNILNATKNVNTTSKINKVNFA